MVTLPIKYISDEHGQTTNVILPISLWEKIKPLVFKEILAKPIIQKDDPIFGLGRTPVDDPQITDASVNHDKYLV